MKKAYKQFTLAMSIVILLQSSALAASATLSVTATILSKSNCKFQSNSTTLAFGDLNPISATDITRQASINFVCNGSAPIATYLIVDDDGLNESGPNSNRMLHATTAGAYLPYSFALSPTTGSVNKGETTSLVVNGTIFGADYRNALVGSYSDTVIITINP